MVARSLGGEMDEGIGAPKQAVVADADGAGDAARQAGLGRSLFKQGQLAEAEQALRRAVRLEPDAAAYHADLARVLLEQGRGEDAVAEFHEAVAYDLGSAAYRADLGRALHGLGRDDEAVQALEAAVEYEPETAAYQADLGQALHRMGRFPEAESALRTAVRLEPGNAVYQGELGLFLLDQGDDKEETAKVLREAVRLDPGNVGYHAGLGQALLALDRLPEAEAELREVVRLSPDTAAYQAELGRVLLRRELFAEAETALREAARLDPANAAYRADLGQVLLRLDRLPEAEAALREAVQLDPDPANRQITDLRTAMSTASDERIVTFVMGQVDQTWDQNALEQRGVVRSEYVEHVNRITRLRLPVLRVPFNNWEEAQRVGDAERVEIRRSMRRNRLVLPISIVVTLQFAGLGAAVYYLGRRITFLTPEEFLILALVAAVAVAANGIVIYRGPPGGVHSRVNRASLVLEDQFRTLVTNLVLEPAITASLAIVWKDSAADLVRIQDGPELSAKADISNVVSTEAHSRLTIALNRKNGAAVGVAGPRGSGKTELARAFTELRPSDPKSRTIPLMMWAPVTYDAQTFLLRLLKELCISILATGTVTPGDNGLVFTSRSRRVAIVIGAAVAAAAGIALVAIKATSTKIGPEVPFGIGALLIIGGAAIAAVVFRPRWPRRRRDVGMSQETISRAADLRTRAEFTETYTRSTQLGISGSGLSLSATGGTQLARIPLNEVDVVREFYALVRSAEVGGWQVCIAIDELDKMQDDAEAIKFLNHIKVLFPIHNCSFIVSVSENAWARFENRGIPFRDAFDSSFDEIVHVHMLQPRESRDLLKRRNTSISDAQALLCHCLSGGLPRDLLRAIRLLARVAGRMQKSGALEPPQLAEVLNVLLAEDLDEKIAAFEIEARTDGRTDVSKANLDSVTCWSDLWPDPGQTARRLAEARPASGGRPVASGSAEPALQPEFQAYMAVLDTIRQAFSPHGPLAELERQATGFDSQLIESGFERIARARRCISTDVDSAWELLDEAREKLGLQAIR
jgi:Flp pilus assembly protein TadD/energy-coupling factor transporter ATP-binding protein EcfA2